ncbi:MAG: NUDIX domain-containing protein [Gammaproteobacteria bacterium]|nr:NUDIX domain-containing protein [Gammaproteobacteria bacterium]
MKEIDKLAWVCIKDKQLLGARSKNNATYYIPGGKRELGESDAEALTREIKEELSVDLLPATITYLETFKAQAHGKPDGVNVKITCYLAEHIGEVQANAEIEEIIWLNHKDKESCSLVVKIIMDWLKSEGMIE